MQHGTWKLSFHEKQMLTVIVIVTVTVAAAIVIDTGCNVDGIRSFDGSTQQLLD